MAKSSQSPAAPSPRKRRSPALLPGTPELSTQELMHELQVHRTQLEMQNDELLRAQVELSSARDRFADLYDFAPVGYVTLSGDGAIAEANLTGASMLGVARKSLLGRRLARFVAPADGERWRRHLHQALQTDGTQRIDLTLQPREGASLHAQLDCLRVAPTTGETMLRITLTDITQRKLAEMNRRIATGAVTSSETERRLVARELHEELGQRLSALKMDLASLAPDVRARGERIGAMLETLDEAVAMVRRIAGDLRPLMLDDLGLSAAIDWLARESERRLGFRISLRLDEIEPEPGEHTAISVYRLLQQTLNHIAQHARATAVSIALSRQGGTLALTVQDNGTGWRALSRRREDEEAATTLHERAHLLGGRLQVDAVAGGGQRFRFSVPLPRA